MAELRVAAPDADADSIETHLAERLGTDVRVGVLLGTRRANQKPVLQVFARDGRSLGYAKIGHNDLTAGWSGARLRRWPRSAAARPAPSAPPNCCTTASGPASRCW